MFVENWSSDFDTESADSFGELFWQAKVITTLVASELCTKVVVTVSDSFQPVGVFFALWDFSDGFKVLKSKTIWSSSTVSSTLIDQVNEFFSCLLEFLSVSYKNNYCGPQEKS